MNSYGLQLRNNLPTQKFSKNPEVYRISRFMFAGPARRCFLYRIRRCPLLHFTCLTRLSAAQISRAQGNWAGRYVKNVCAEMYTEYEEALRSLQTKAKGHYILLVCTQETGLCSGDDAADESLADYSVFADATVGKPTHFKPERPPQPDL